MKMRLIIASMTFVLSVGIAQAEIYRWVDKGGRVQYSDQPPPGVDAQKVTGKSATGSQGAASGKSYQEQDQESRKRRVEEGEKAKKNATEEQQAKAVQQNCTRSKNQLASLQSGGRISRVNEKGEREVLDDKGIEAATADATKAVADWCQ